MSGVANGAFCNPTCTNQYGDGPVQHTCCFEGETRTKLSGFAIRNMKDSTLNWDPRNMTEAKSTPKTRANSLHGINRRGQIDLATYAFLVIISA